MDECLKVSKQDKNQRDCVGVNPSSCAVDKNDITVLRLEHDSWGEAADSSIPSNSYIPSTPPTTPWQVDDFTSSIFTNHGTRLSELLITLDNKQAYTMC